MILFEGPTNFMASQIYRLLSSMPPCDNPYYANLRPSEIPGMANTVVNMVTRATTSNCRVLKNGESVMLFLQRTLRIRARKFPESTPPFDKELIQILDDALLFYRERQKMYNRLRFYSVSPTV